MFIFRNVRYILVKMAEVGFRGCEWDSSPAPGSEHLLMLEHSTVPIISVCGYRLLAVWLPTAVRKHSKQKVFPFLWSPGCTAVRSGSFICSLGIHSCLGHPHVSRRGCRRASVTMGGGPAVAAVGPASGLGHQAVLLRRLQVRIIPVRCTFFSCNELWGYRFFKQYYEKK